MRRRLRPRRAAAAGELAARVELEDHVGAPRPADAQVHGDAAVREAERPLHRHGALERASHGVEATTRVRPWPARWRPVARQSV